MIYFINPEAVFYINVSDKKGFSTNINTFVRAHQEFIKMRFEAIVAELKYCSVTESENSYVEEMNIELYTNLIIDELKSVFGKAYVVAEKYGEGGIAEVRDMVKKMAENPKEKDSIITINNAIGRINNNLRWSFEDYT